MPLSLEGFKVRPANSFEKHLFEAPPQAYRLSPNPTKSKYYELWMKIEDLLARGEDVIVTRDDIGYYDIHDVRRGIRRLSNEAPLAYASGFFFSFTAKAVIF